MARKINFKKIRGKAKKLKAETPRLIAGEAVTHFKRSFRDQGFTDQTLEPWKARKTSNKADRRTKKRRAILIDSGDLRRSIRSKKYSFRSIVVGAYGVFYSRFHNRGTGKLPQRQFMGNSKKLNLAVRRIIAKRFREALKAK